MEKKLTKYNEMKFAKCYTGNLEQKLTERDTGDAWQLSITIRDNYRTA